MHWFVPTTNMPKGIFATKQYLEAFFRNLILGEQNELKNRYLHVSAETQSAIFAL